MRTNKSKREQAQLKLLVVEKEKPVVAKGLEDYFGFVVEKPSRVSNAQHRQNKQPISMVKAAQNRNIFDAGKMLGIHTHAEALVYRGEEEKAARRTTA